MSEKRFQMGRRIDVVSDIYDSQNDKLLILSDVVDLLNTQQDQINSLILSIKAKDRHIKNQQVAIKKLQDLCGESDGENMKLRIENKRLCDEIKLLKPTNVEQYEQIVQLQEENEQLKKQIQIYEQLISNSYVGEEETLDGFVGKYVIWEDELQKYKEKIKKVIDDE